MAADRMASRRRAGCMRSASHRGPVRAAARSDTRCVSYGTQLGRVGNMEHSRSGDVAPDMQDAIATVQRVPARQVRAVFDAHTITVYQAYSPTIAEPAIAAGRFVPPFKLDRMTWIKPSFLWMMYRSGWATKPGQERVLAIQITREGFEWALGHSALSSYEPGLYASQQEWAERKRATPVRVQWDPERSLLLEPLGHRAIQIGLTGEATRHYVQDWTAGITDVTGLAYELHDLVAAGDVTAASEKLPANAPTRCPTASTRT